MVDAVSFPQKLYALLHQPDTADRIGTGPQTEIIPKFFKHTKLTSFQRQLNFYGFRRLTKGSGQGEATGEEREMMDPPKVEEKREHRTPRAT